MTTVHLLRHGEVHNPTGVLYGRLPGFKLSDLGVRQADLAAEYLAERPIRYIVSSPLQRALQTAQPLAMRLDLHIETDDRLIEASNHLEGRPVAGGKGLFKDPALFKYYRNPFRPSWGEPYVEVARRVLAAARAARDVVTDLAADLGADAEAVCVSHQLPIVCARRFVEGKRLFHDPRRRQCALASVTTFTFEGDRVVRVAYAEPAASLPSGSGAGA